MSLCIEKIDPQNLQQANTYISWHSNSTMINNWLLHNESPSEITYTLEDFKSDYSKEEKTAFMLKSEGQYIGYGSFFINHPVGKFKEGKVCWPSIGIGSDEWRGKGFGKLICQKILELAKEQSCTHIEAAVFSFNDKMKSILLGNGFKYIDKEESRTYVNGKWWDSEHYLLEL